MAHRPSTASILTLQHMPLFPSPHTIKASPEHRSHQRAPPTLPLPSSWATTAEEENCPAGMKLHCLDAPHSNKILARITTQNTQIALLSLPISPLPPLDQDVRRAMATPCQKTSCATKTTRNLLPKRKPHRSTFRAMCASQVPADSQVPVAPSHIPKASSPRLLHPQVGMNKKASEMNRPDFAPRQACPVSPAPDCHSCPWCC